MKFQLTKIEVHLDYWRPRLYQQIYTRGNSGIYCVLYSAIMKNLQLKIDSFKIEHGSISAPKHAGRRLIFESGPGVENRNLRVPVHLQLKL